MGTPWKSSKALEAISYKEIGDINSYAEEVISNLPTEVLDKLFEGNKGDVDKVMESLLLTIHEIVNFNNTSTIRLSDVEGFEDHFDLSMKKLCYNYFKSTVLLNFNQNWRNIEWGSMIQLYPYSAYLAQRGSGKSYEFCMALPLWRLYRYDNVNVHTNYFIDNKNSKDTVIITNESKLGKLHLEKVANEIRYNPILYDRLYIPKKDLGREKIFTKNGATVDLRTYGSFIRGLHVGCAIVDDFLDKSCLYSHEQREKFKEVFYAEIMNIVEPHGCLYVSGTPFHTMDLYGNLKNNQLFKVFEYPGIFPDGRLLAPDRFTFKGLMDLKKTMGSIVFSREILVTPVIDSSTIFPWEYLKKSIINMSTISYVDNIQSFPIKMERVTVGLDFAISGNIGADYSAFTVWGRGVDKKYYLLYLWRKSGASHQEQVSQIVRINQTFKPNKIIAENNGFQRILINLVEERGIDNIEPFTTTSDIKKDWYQGLPSLSVLFERGEIKLPYSEEAKNDTDLVLGEFNSITFNDDSGKLESSSEHDDTVMSSFFALTDLRENKVNIEFFYL